MKGLWVSGYSHSTKGSHRDYLLDSKGQKALLKWRDPTGTIFRSDQTYYQKKH